MAFAQNGSFILASDSAGSCNPGQTPTQQQTDGSGTLRLTKSGDCPVTNPDSGQTEVIVGSVIGVIVFIVCISIALYIVIRRQKLKQSVKHEDEEQRSRHTPSEASEVTLVEYTGILSLKQSQPDTEKTPTCIEKLMTIFQFQSSNKNDIDKAIVLGRLTSQIYPDTPEPETVPPDRYDSDSSDLEDQTLNGRCDNCRLMECNADSQDGVGWVKKDSEDNMTNGPSESISEISNEDDIERNMTEITEEQIVNVKTTNISESLYADTFAETDSARTNNYKFAQEDKSSEVDNKRIVKGDEVNHLIVLLNEKSPKELSNDERDHATNTTSGVTRIEESSERKSKSQFVVQTSKNQRTENRDPEEEKSLEDSTLPEKQNITDRQTDVKNDEESNASYVSKLGESLARKMPPQLSGVKLNLSLSSSQKTPKISLSKTFNSEKTTFDINNDDATEMALGAKHERKKGLILLSDFANSKSGQKTVSFNV